MNQFTRYNQWILDHCSENQYGQCAVATAQMVEQFPELRRVRGHYYCHIWGEREHWWCVTESGFIVDPTKEQFPSKGNGVYVEWDELQPEPTGICPNCGEYCYNGGYCCSERCHNQYVAYCTGGY